MGKTVKLTGEQRAVLEAGADIKRVIACAGSGKTWVITRGIIDTLQQGLCRPSEVLALTFTRNAADNMRIRIRENMGNMASDQIDIFTFNSFGNQIIKDNSLKLGLGKDFRVLGGAETWQIIYDIFKNNEFKYLDIGKIPGKTVQEILSYIDALKNNLITPADLENYISKHYDYIKDYKSSALLKEEKQSIRLQEELCFIYRKYDEQKKVSNCIDYQDQVVYPYFLLKNNNQVREKYLKRYKYIFVDEFQDTNIAQAYLLALLNKKGKNITVVGDDDQGIYAFRGACVENILNFHLWEEFADSKVVDYYLTTNFRSGENIIEVTNNIISPNKNRFDKSLKPAEKSPPSEVLFFYRPTHEQESERIAGIINELRNRGVRLKNIAIISRRKKFDSITRHLEKKGLKYEMVGSKGFYFEKEILFIISWLYVIYDVYDELNLLYVLKSDKYKICDRDLFFLKRNSKGGKPVRLIDGIECSRSNTYISPEAQERLNEFLSELKYYISKSYTLKLKELISLIYEYSRLRDELKSSFDAAAKKKIRNIESLIKVASDFEDNFHENSLESFNTYLREVAKTDFEGPDTPELSSEDSVKVMSIHAAKGLEFDIVLVPMLWKNDYLGRKKSLKFSIPASLRKDNRIWAEKKGYSSRKAFNDDLSRLKIEEERRIFYVACSRAKKLLILSYSEYQNQHDRANGRARKEAVPFILDALASVNLKAMDNESLKFTESKGFVGKTKKTICRNYYEFLETGKKFSSPGIDWAQANQYLLKKSSRARKKSPKRGKLFAPAAFVKKQNVFSLTSLLTYLQCPALYKWKYINFVPQKFSKSIETGEKVHSLIEKITMIKMAKNELNPQKVLCSIKDESLKPFADIYMQSDFFKLEKILKIWLEQLIYYKIKGYVITSKIDRLEYTGGKYMITDYKVSEKPADGNHTHISQLKGYVLACADTFSCNTRQIGACLFYLKNPSIVKYNFKTEILENTKEVLLSAIENINNGRFDSRKRRLCIYCSYRDFCKP